MSVTITREEWLAEIERVMQSPEDGDGMTVLELAEAMGWCEKRAREALHKLNRAKRIVVTRGTRYALDGRRASVPLYRIVS